MSAAFVILIVEDDPDDVFFLREAFKQVDMEGALQVARDGVEAVVYLQGGAPYEDRRRYPLPSLILLDLNLPRKTGFEVLEWCRRQPGLRRIPVIVLTSSRSEEDVARAYDLGANSYLVKPIDSAAQLEMVKAIRLYWAGLNITPGVEIAH